MSFFGNNSLLARKKDSISKLSGLTLWLDASDGATIVFNGTTVSQWKDKSGNNRDALQSTSAAQPTTASSPSRVVFNKSTQKLVSNLPTVSGTMFLATPNGTQVYGVNIPAGDYDIGARGGLYMPDNSIIGQIICAGSLSSDDQNSTLSWLRSKGGGNNYGAVTTFTNFWRNWSEITSFPLVDTSNGTVFSSAWNGCSGLTSFPALNMSKGTTFNGAWLSCSNLTSFPLINVTSGTSFTSAWRLCQQLVTFPANFFNGCPATDFTGAFTSTKLSQTSIDNILVSINSNGTSNGTFNQSGGSAPSAIGQAAITAMRSRGWTVAVTGGF